MEKKHYIALLIVGLLLLGGGITMAVFHSKFQDELNKKYPLPPDLKGKLAPDRYTKEVQTSSESSKSSGLIVGAILGIVLGLLTSIICTMQILGRFRR